MKPTEHKTKRPIATTGFFAVLCGLLQIKGTGALSHKHDNDQCSSSQQVYEYEYDQVQLGDASQLRFMSMAHSSDHRLSTLSLSCARIKLRLSDFPTLRLGGIALCITLGCLLVSTSPAQANGGYVETGTPIGGCPEPQKSKGECEAAGQLDLAAPSYEEILTTLEDGEKTFEKSNIVQIAGSGVVVNDATHDVYVADTNNHRISEFEANGTFLRAFGANVGGPGIDTCTLLTECHKGGGGSAPGELAAPRFVAVDNSCALHEQETHKVLSNAECATLDPSNGDVYAGDGVGAAALNELQFVSFNGASEGTYTLTFGHETTALLSYSIEEGRGLYEGARHVPDVKAAQAALEALAGIGPGKISVTGVGGKRGELIGLEIEFTGALAETALPALGCDGSVLAPAGASCSTKVGREGSKFAGEVISKFSAEGELIKSWGVNGQLDGPTAEKGPFEGKLEGLAVDPAGNLFAMDEGEKNDTDSDLFEFEQAGSQVGETLVFEGAKSGNLSVAHSASGIAVNGAGDLYAISSKGAVEEYSPTGQPLSSSVSGNHAPFPTGFALDEATGQVQAFVGLGESLEKGDAECVAGGPCGVFSSTQLDGTAGVAVDPGSGAVYAASTVPDLVDVFSLLLSAETSPATEVTATSMTVHGEVDPEGSEVANCYFEYGPTASYGQTAPCEPDAEQIGGGVLPVPVHADLTELQGGTVYHFRVVAVKQEKAIPGNDVAAPVTLPLPVLSAEEATEVTSTSATLSASVDPENVAVEACTFEYDTGTSYGTNVPCKPDVQHIGAGTEPVPVKAAIEGLEPNTTYHWRLSVKDAHGEVHTPDHVFSYPTAGNTLPDNRTYEMVTPPFKNGAAVGVVLGGPDVAIAEDGSDIDVSAIQCYGGSRSCTANRYNNGEPVEFTRGTAGWTPTFMAPPATSFSANSYWLASPDQELGLFSMPSPPGGQDDWYLRETDGSFTNIGPVTPPADGDTNYETGIGMYTATADFSHLVWEGLKAQQWTSLGVPPAEGNNGQVYEYSGACGGQTECEAAKPLLVGVNDEGRPLGCPVALGDGNYSRLQGAVSADGRTIFFTACEKELYARIDGGEAQAHTVTLNTPACVEGQPGAAECKAVSGEHRVPNFQGASTDGSRAYFLDTQKLTDDATQGTGNASRTSVACAEGGADCNLYLSECTKECETLHEQRRLIDVSAGDVSGFGPNVQGVVGTSADGSHVYFVAKGVLTAGERPGCGAAFAASGSAEAGRCHAQSGADNLYVYDTATSRTSFIASLPGADIDSWTAFAEDNVTPDGSYLVFASHGDLTPDATRTDEATQIYRYDAPSEQMTRVSIGADGYNDNGNAGVGNASIVVPSVTAVPYRGDPTMSNDGSRVFFQSPVGLTPHALNDVQIETVEDTENGTTKFVPVYADNVYEWQQAGVSGCPPSDASGCVYLISDGRDVHTDSPSLPCGQKSDGFDRSAVCLLGTDATGDNVFFSTADQLVPEDTDTQVDIYDAQVCSSSEPCAPHQAPPPEPCQGEQCHGIPEATPSLLAPGTATFNGEGNVASPPPPAKPAVKKKTVTCKRGHVKKKVHKKETCVRKKTKKDKTAKKSSKSKRGGKS